MRHINFIAFSFDYIMLFYTHFSNLVLHIQTFLVLLAQIQYLNLCFITCPSRTTAIITKGRILSLKNSRGANPYIFKNVGVKIQKILVFRTLLLTFSKNLGRRYLVVNSAPLKFFTFLGKQSPSANPRTLNFHDHSEVYPEPWQTSKIPLFSEIVSGF